MRLSEVVELYKKKEETFIEINEKIEFEDIPVDIGTRIILNKGERKRLIDLGILSLIYKKNRNFVQDYLDLDSSLDNIHEKYGVYTELEFLSICCQDLVSDLDLKAVLEKLKTYILSREKEADE
ncbi:MULTISPECIES: hypothetical protein [Acidianus]|uniref:Uncharacterized protein n=1 Tax=Candidatus Acidianus copahuensis TaxID=1160895 RepID=A0A031LN59_9CREN|nr:MULTISPECIES: hypothetical protein [Acidianus]EZQ04835.1 hypothetical protein CM19_07580 [Candidatus Acidianus copahuensis]NON62792.1 hypothetical protein [Acidianus sp. RZ1]